jgi:pyruvate formate lyase activating enzyme
MGTIFAIKKYAIHDGPNIRTTIFFKGCPLSCQWCHNPEGLELEIGMLWNRDKCIGCGECIQRCQTQSLTEESGGLKRDVKLCTRCGQCADICPALAHQATGWQASVAEILTEIKKDIPFYDQSGGGVTFSGGEPMMQPEFLLQLLRACGELGIHRAVDTSAYASTEMILEVADHTELFLIDLKHMDSDLHKLYTGVPNELILHNIEQLARRGAAINIRIPLIEGVNSDDENMRLSAEFLATLPGVEHIDVLPYHDIATGKYTKLGQQEKNIHFAPISTDRVMHCTKILTERNLKVQVGG